MVALAHPPVHYAEVRVECYCKGNVILLNYQRKRPLIAVRLMLAAWWNGNVCWACVTRVALLAWSKKREA